MFELFCEGVSWGTSNNENASVRGFMMHSLYNYDKYFELRKDGETFMETKKNFDKPIMEVITEYAQ